MTKEQRKQKRNTLLICFGMLVVGAITIGAIIHQNEVDDAKCPMPSAGDNWLNLKPDTK